MIFWRKPSTGRAYRRLTFAILLGTSLLATGPAAAQPGITTIATEMDFETLTGRLEAAIIANEMILVAKASASGAAAKRGIQILGDAVLFIYRNDFAVRMLRADPNAGIEAPVPIHVFETSTGKAGLAYRRPSSIFRPYENKKLDEMANELDVIFDRIVAQTVLD